jgi:putative glutamine amidotransferase
MRRPVIGYTIEFQDPLLRTVEPRLREPLAGEGALPIMLPRTTPPADVADLLELVDAVMLSGGDDVDPGCYGHDPHHLTQPAAAGEDAFEIAIARAALDRGMPVLGICRGAQVLAVADGGTLTQDVETLHAGAHTHRYAWSELALLEPGDHWHEVVAEPGSRVEAWLRGGPPRVNSFHHQCVASTGRVLTPTARTLDGVIEATERTDGAGWAAGLQWHNEMMWPWDERFLAPFAELVQAARTYAANGCGPALESTAAVAAVPPGR